MTADLLRSPESGRASTSQTDADDSIRTGADAKAAPPLLNASPWTPPAVDASFLSDRLGLPSIVEISVRLPDCLPVRIPLSALWPSPDGFPITDLFPDLEQMRRFVVAHRDLPAYLRARIPPRPGAPSPYPYRPIGFDQHDLSELGLLAHATDPIDQLLCALSLSRKLDRLRLDLGVENAVTRGLHAILDCLGRHCAGDVRLFLSQVGDGPFRCPHGSGVAFGVAVDDVLVPARLQPPSRAQYDYAGRRIRYGDQIGSALAMCLNLERVTVDVDDRWLHPALVDFRQLVRSMLDVYRAGDVPTLKALWAKVIKADDADHVPLPTMSEFADLCASLPLQRSS